MEVWKCVPNYEGFYQVSDLGSVRSVDRIIIDSRGGVRNYKSRILKPGRALVGYLFVRLSKDSKCKSYYVHQLVTMAFLGHKPDGFKVVVDHINNIKNDNRLLNLQLVSQRENTSKDRYRQKYTSKYVGVYFKKKREKYSAGIHIEGININLGNFESEIEASKAYNKALNDFKSGVKLNTTRKKNEHVGVSWCNTYNQWVANITINYKQKHLGRFDCKIKASNAREKYRKELKL